ncbi:hypothetical protein [Pseudomonas sichuanensis]|uniref:hypothetical protein n=1 Tax=Pseudomonas sichuanensis TaxID=2213015 RepID=UPI002ACB0808|nr:hypothetical protein [Pseudomonas sichuanensis]
MAVRLDLPVVQAAACRDRLAVQQVGVGPGVVFAVELEQRNAGEGLGMGMALSVNRTFFVKVQFLQWIAHFFGLNRS